MLFEDFKFRLKMYKIVRNALNNFSQLSKFYIIVTYNGIKYHSYLRIADN